MLSESALIHFYESVGFFTAGATPTRIEDARILEAVLQMAFLEPPKKREPPKVIQIILEVSKLLFFCCVCMFFFDEGWICTVYILGAERGRWKVLLFLLRRQASS